jgi:hypothetical protein
MQVSTVRASLSLCDRRSFLRIGGGLALAGGIPWSAAMARSQPHSESHFGQARSCIFIYLLGGPPHLDMWDLKPRAPAEIRGPFRPIATFQPGLQICEHLPRLAAIAGRWALVRSVSHNNHNHTPMIYYTLTGHPVERPEQDNDVRAPLRTDFPHVGAVLARFMASPHGLPGYVAIPEVAVRSSLAGEFRRARTLLRGGGAGFLGPLLDPLGVNGAPGTADAIPALQRAADISGERLEQRAALVTLLESRQPALTAARVHGALRDQAMALTGATGGAAPIFALDSEPVRLHDRYGRHRFGQAPLLARRLAAAQVPMIAIHFNEMTMCDGWDTHSRNFEALQGELLPMLDQGLSALLDDLDQRGLLEQTVVAVLGEFGRTPRINGAAGRDHWGLCQSVLLAGGGIQGGRVHGASDRIAAYPMADAVDPVDIHATLYHCLGVEPHRTIHDHLQRPYPITTGRVIDSLL